MSRRPRVYAAHPVTSDGSDRERICLDALRHLLSGAEIIDPSRQYRNSADWLANWPRLVDDMSGLVVFADDR